MSQLKLEKYRLGQIIKEVIDSFAKAALAKNVLLKSVQTDVSSEVFCDKDRIMQVLSKLIGNALKFTPESGTTTVDIAFNETEFQVSVCESGTGIRKGKRLQIFERYAQLGMNNRFGLGLGLYISKMLVEAHQGRLWVSSRLGHGSTFSFTVPKSSGRKD